MKYIIIIFIILLISGCNYVNLPTKEDFMSTKECKNWAFSKTQKEYILYEGKESGTWFDKDNANNIYSKGTFKGENINYFYYRGSRTKPFKIEETVVDERGNIIGTRKAEFFPIIKPVANTEETYQTIVGLKRLKQTFRLYDLEMISCRIIT